MGLNEEERIILVQREFEKAEAFYEQAIKNADLGFWDLVANRLYYSAFHAVSALLISDQHKVGTHKGAVLMFGFHYVKTGIFSSEEGRFYSQLQSVREKADYNCIWEATEQEISPMIPNAEQFLSKIRDRLSSFLNTELQQQKEEQGSESEAQTPDEDFSIK